MCLKTLHPVVLWSRESGSAGQHEPAFLPAPGGHFGKHVSPSSQRKTSAPSLSLPALPYASLSCLDFRTQNASYRSLERQVKSFLGRKCVSKPHPGGLLLSHSGFEFKSSQPPILCRDSSKFFCHSNFFLLPPEQSSRSFTPSLLAVHKIMLGDMQRKLFYIDSYAFI